MNGQHARVARIIGRRYLFHAPGITYAVTAMVLILGAINGQNNLLFAIFGLSVGGLIVSGVISGANLMGVRVSRLTSLEGRRGERATIRYAVRNANRFVPAFGLVIEELPSAADAGHGRLSRIAAFAPHVPAGRSVIVEASPRCLARGPVRLRRFRVTSTFPFGLTRKSVELECDEEVLVLPASAQPVGDPVRRAAGDRFSRADRRASRQGDEFHSLREYAEGDPLRSVAWRASARGEQLLVRQRARRSAGRVLIEFERADDEAAQERIISCVAALGELAMRQGHEYAAADPKGLMLVDFASGASHQRTLLAALARWRPEADAVAASGARARDITRLRVGPGDAASFGDGAVRLACDDPACFTHPATEVTA